jgi:hypothetical protein
MSFLLHVYQFAEVYTVILSWIVLPLGYGACYLFFNQHYGMFSGRVNG